MTRVGRVGTASTPRVRLMLDSGVFSAWSRGEEINIKDYIAYIKRHDARLFSYVNCDVIPGKFGTKRTQADIAASGLGSYRNQQRLKEAGLHPIPVFHMEESWTWLEQLLADGEPYIGISSSKDRMPQQQREWLDQVFTVLTDSEGRPLVKIHGFGITNPKMLMRYPFYSVDSTTWSLTPGYGQIIIPQLGDPDNFGLPPTRVVISGVQHNNNTNQQKQFEAMGELYQKIITDFLDKQCSIEVAEARYGTTIRRRALLLYYLGLVKALKDVRFTEPSASFHINCKVPKSLKPITIPQLHIMFATNLSKEWSALLNEVGANTRLLSYYELKSQPDKTLVDYVETGTVEEYIKRAPKRSYTSEAYRNWRRLGTLARHNEYAKRDKETT